jgi:Xaa-Pro dipeptidase
MNSRRDFLQATLALSVLGSLPIAAAAPNLKSVSAAAQPISKDERHARVAKAQSLMGEGKIRALLIEPGSSLEYFTGIQWHRSERSTVAIIPASGSVMVVTPAFEEPSVRETFEIGGDIRPWDEHESPFEKDRSMSARSGHRFRITWPPNPPCASSSSPAFARSPHPMTSNRPTRW